MLDKYFEYKKHKTNFKTEVIAGVTTFLTMAYIMFLNPFILSGEFAGPEKGFFDFGAVFTATNQSNVNSTTPSVRKWDAHSNMLAIGIGGLSGMTNARSLTVYLNSGNTFKMDADL